MPTFTLHASESFCGGVGVTLFVLGLITLFIPRHFRLGVVAMCCGNIFFVMAIAFPKKIAEFCQSLGFEATTLSEDFRYLGVLVGLLLAALLYFLSRAHLVKPKAQSANAQGTSAQHKSKSKIEPK